MIIKGDKMNDRKQHVIKMAHQLFVDKGFQATSIQDILDYSGISKGTFYNYFSSKNELLIAIFKEIYNELEKERNKILIGQDPSDIELFIKQIELQLNTNKKNKLFNLFEEVLVSKDIELKQFINEGQLRMYHWIVQRFTEIFGTDKKPYLLDCALMFLGILSHMMKYYLVNHNTPSSVYKVVRYSVRRIENIVEELAETNEQLTNPELLEKLLQTSNSSETNFSERLSHTILILKKDIFQHQKSEKYIELLDFIENELINQNEPRKYLIELALSPLKEDKDAFEQKNVIELEQLITLYFDE